MEHRGARACGNVNVQRIAINVSCLQLHGKYMKDYEKYIVNAAKQWDATGLETRFAVSNMHIHAYSNFNK